MQIVFLCGGLGTRLKNKKTKWPKGLIKINNKHFFDYILDSINKFNPCSLHFCLGYKSELYIDYIKKLEYKIKITYSCENPNKLLGTGGAIKKACKYLKDDFIVQYGDSILEFNYRKLFDLHIKKKMPMTMTILNQKKTSELPNILCVKNSNGEFNCKYDKKRLINNANYIDYGAIAFKKSIFEKEKKITFDLSDIQSNLTKKNKCAYLEVNRRYIEIGTLESLNEAVTLLK